MVPQTQDLAAALARLDTILERLNRLELQVPVPMQSESVEAEAFVLRDQRAQVRARLDLWDHAPRLTFHDGIGDERLLIGPQTDGTADVADPSQ